MCLMSPLLSPMSRSVCLCYQRLLRSHFSAWFLVRVRACRGSREELSSQLSDMSADRSAKDAQLAEAWMAMRKLQEEREALKRDAALALEKAAASASVPPAVVAASDTTRFEAACSGPLEVRDAEQLTDVLARYIGHPDVYTSVVEVIAACLRRYPMESARTLAAPTGTALLQQLLTQSRLPLSTRITVLTALCDVLTWALRADGVADLWRATGSDLQNLLTRACGGCTVDFGSIVHALTSALGNGGT